MTVADLYDLIEAGQLPASNDAEERLAVLEDHGAFIEAEQATGVDAGLLFDAVKEIADARAAGVEATASVLDLLSV